MGENESPAMIRRWARRAALSLPLLAVPGPCSTFDEIAPGPTIAPSDGGRVDTPESEAGHVEVYLTVADAVRACSLVARCETLSYSLGLSIGVPVQATEFAACVHILSSPVPPARLGVPLQRSVLERVAAARDCNAALAAVPVVLLAPGDRRCAAGASTCESATSAVYCGADAGVGTLHRCEETRGGASCKSVELPDGGGTYGLCAKGACDGFVPDAYCEGTVLHACDPMYSTLASTFDCAWLGLACGTGAGRFGACGSPGGRACDSFGAATCDDDVASYCTYLDRPRVSPFDCRGLGARCVATSRTRPVTFCVRADATCSPLDAGDCDGSRIALCVDGQPASFDCASVGKQCRQDLRACW